MFRTAIFTFLLGFEVRRDCAASKVSDLMTLIFGEAGGCFGVGSGAGCDCEGGADGCR